VEQLLFGLLLLGLLELLSVEIQSETMPPLLRISLLLDFEEGVAAQIGLL
jgi:hypothetical protein